ncbi:hypothetical protein K9M42_01575 [Patescibacteria group bacterium]|nr:hypothetical protein [Patescibacteria group bacterium]
MKEFFNSSEDFINSFDKYEDENEFYPNISLDEFDGIEEDINFDTIGGSSY